MWNKNICLSNKKTIFVIVIILCCTLALASVLRQPENTIPPVVEPPVEQVEEIDSCEIWIPSEEDIAYQDSMFTIIQNTQDDITEIKEDIVFILERLDYEDGTYDSIRYVRGGKIDKIRNKENQSR